MRITVSTVLTPNWSARHNFCRMDCGFMMIRWGGRVHHQLPEWSVVWLSGSQMDSWQVRNVRFCSLSSSTVWSWVTETCFFSFCAKTKQKIFKQHSHWQFFIMMFYACKFTVLLKMEIVFHLYYRKSSAYTLYDSVVKRIFNDDWWFIIVYMPGQKVAWYHWKGNTLSFF